MSEGVLDTAAISMLPSTIKITSDLVKSHLLLSTLPLTYDFSDREWTSAVNDLPPFSNRLIKLRETLVRVREIRRQFSPLPSLDLSSQFTFISDPEVRKLLGDLLLDRSIKTGGELDAALIRQNAESMLAKLGVNNARSGRQVTLETVVESLLSGGL